MFAARLCIIGGGVCVGGLIELLLGLLIGDSTLIAVGGGFAGGALFVVVVGLLIGFVTDWDL